MPGLIFYFPLCFLRVDLCGRLCYDTIEIDFQYTEGCSMPCPISFVLADRGTIPAGTAVYFLPEGREPASLPDKLRRALPCPVGQARLLPDPEDPLHFLICTVPPHWLDGNHGEEEWLSSCYKNSIALAAESGIKHIIFPSDTAGGCPPRTAARIALGSILHGLQRSPELAVSIVCSDPMALKRYQFNWNMWFEEEHQGEHSP